jgi:hypothetical protein
MKKRKTMLGKKTRTSTFKNNSSDLCRPICRTEDKPLGSWMSELSALEIANDHTTSNPTHDVDIEKHN